MKKDIFTNYLVKLREIVEKDDFNSIDYSLEFMYASVPEKDRLDIEDILKEVTLYSEFKEKDYKEEALKLINEFEASLADKK
jgi:hypothetical protein